MLSAKGHEALGFTVPLQAVQGFRIEEELPKLTFFSFFLQGKSPILMMVYTTKTFDTWGALRNFGDPQSKFSL